MKEQKIQSSDFDKGVRLFVEILAAQPGLISLGQGASDIKGQQLATMAVEFAKKFTLLRSACKNDDSQQ